MPKLRDPGRTPIGSKAASAVSTTGVVLAFDVGTDVLDLGGRGYTADAEENNG